VSVEGFSTRARVAGEEWGVSCSGDYGVMWLDWTAV